MRLAHGWRLDCPPDVRGSLVHDFLRPAVRAVPRAMAQRLPACRILVDPGLDASIASRWRDTDAYLEIALAASDEDHAVALELLLCIGQALWERLAPEEREGWWRLLGAEIHAGTGGEIDEQALGEKRLLLKSRTGARSRRRLERWARASFAGTAAEYVHALWHDVTVRTGPEHLEPPALRARLERLAEWFPPARGRRLFGR
jgi:hypothetical protein